MGKDSFSFRRFTVRQDRCAMKVGTDGTLLGAWANGGRRVLDIGTGSGLVALMMAQRFADASITGVEIDPDAAAQAQENVEASPFAERVTIVCGDICSWEPDVAEGYDAIVCNPPYFANDLHCPDQRRTLARHDTTLTFAMLMAVAKRMLADDGELSVVVPTSAASRIEAEAALAGFETQRRWAVRTTPAKEPGRWLMAFGRHSAAMFDSGEGVIETSPGVRSEWYGELTKQFYLK